MISPADAEKMSAQLDAIDAEIETHRSEIKKMTARIAVLSAEIQKMREKLL